MTKKQLEKIKTVTTYTLEQITQMNDREFWTNITQLLANKRITPEQHKWLDGQRTGKGLTQTEINAINIFSGKIIK